MKDRASSRPFEDSLAPLRPCVETSGVSLLLPVLTELRGISDQAANLIERAVAELSTVDTVADTPLVFQPKRMCRQESKSFVVARAAQHDHGVIAVILTASQAYANQRRPKPSRLRFGPDANRPQPDCTKP